jgi:aldehyde dehydrogenase (NAD+)
VDLNKPRLESALAELSPTVDACLHAIKNLEEWSKPDYPERAPSHSLYELATHNVPVGTVLFIAFVL